MIDKKFSTALIVRGTGLGMKSSNSSQQLLLYKHLLEIFRPKNVEDVLINHLSQEIDGSIKRRRNTEEQEWILPIWEPSLTSFQSSDSLNHLFTSFPSWADFQVSKIKGRFQIFFAFLPQNYFQNYINKQNSLVIDELKDEVANQHSDNYFSMLNWKKETPLAYLELDQTGYCQKAEVSPLLMALMGMSRENLNKENLNKENFNEDWNPKNWISEAQSESRSLEQEYRRSFEIDNTRFEADILQPVLKRWSDRLQGLKNEGPFPFFQGWLGIRLTSETTLSFTSFFDVELQKLWSTEIIKDPLKDDFFKWSPALEAWIDPFTLVEDAELEVHDALHPKRLGLSGVKEGLNIDNQVVFAKIKDTFLSSDYLKLNRPLGTDSFSVLEEWVGDVFVERANRISKLPNPEAGLAPIDPNFTQIKIPMDAIIEHSTILYITHEQKPLNEFLKWNISNYFPAFVFKMNSDLKIKSSSSLNQFGLDESLKSFLNFLEQEDWDSVQTDNMDIDWEKAKSAFLIAKSNIDSHLQSLSRNIRWVQDWKQISQREVELDMEYQEKFDSVELMKKEHLLRFEQLRELHQQSKQSLQVLEKDLSKFTEQVKRMKDKLSQKTTMPSWDKFLSWMGIQTQQVQQLSEQRKEYLLVLKRSRADREQCKEQLDKIRKQVRKSMKEIEELKINHLEKQEELELQLANLEREKDDIELKIQKLSRNREDYPVDIEAVLTFWKEKREYYDPSLLNQLCWFDAEKNWLTLWLEKRHELLEASSNLHKATLLAWKSHLKNGLPWFKKWLNQKELNQEEISPQMHQKIWNMLGLWMPFKQCSITKDWFYFKNLPQQSLGLLWADEKLAHHPVFPVLLDKSNKVVELREPYTPSITPFYASWLKKKLGIDLEFSSSSNLDNSNLDFHIQNQSASPFFEISNTLLYEEKLTNETNIGQIQEIIPLSWICVNPHNRLRHLEQGPMDEWAWLHKKIKEWKKSWPICSFENGQTRDASIQICVLFEEWKKIIQDLLDEARLTSQIEVSSLEEVPIKSDWVIMVLGSFHPKMEEEEMQQRIQNQLLLRPIYHLSLLGDTKSWQILHPFLDKMDCGFYEEKCVVSGGLKEKIGSILNSEYSNSKINEQSSSIAISSEEDEVISTNHPPLLDEDDKNTHLFYQKPIQKEPIQEELIQEKPIKEELIKEESDPSFVQKIPEKVIENHSQEHSELDDIFTHWNDDEL